MPDRIPVAPVPDPAAVRGNAANLLPAVAANLSAAGTDLKTAPYGIPDVTAILSAAVGTLPALCRDLAHDTGDTWTRQPGNPPALSSLWFHLHAAADAAARLVLALDTAHAAAVQLHKDGEDR